MFAVKENVWSTGGILESRNTPTLSGGGVWRQNGSSDGEKAVIREKAFVYLFFRTTCIKESSFKRP